MHRMEVLKFGTTRGHVLASLLMFAADAETNLFVMDEIDEASGW